MERMRFQAIDRTGKAVIMEISANDETSAKRQLRRMGYTPVRSVAAREGFSFAGLLKGEHHFDLYHFTCRLSPLLLANIPLEKALDEGWKILADCFDKTETGIKSELVEKFWPK